MAGMTKLAIISNITVRVNSGHILCDTTSRVAPASDQSVGSANNVLVEEAGSPDLARNECSTKNANKEPDEVQSHSIVCRASQGSWNGAHEEQTRKSQARANVVAHGASNCTNKKRRHKCNNVGVGDLVLRQMHICFDALT
jgi:hypothetical protein